MRIYSDRDGDPVLSIDVVPTSEALGNAEQRKHLFAYTRKLTHQTWRQAPGYLNVVNVVSRQHGEWELLSLDLKQQFAQLLLLRVMLSPR